MIPARLSFRYEFTPVPSCGSVFVYMIPAQNVITEQVILVLYQYEIFITVRKLIPMSCKRGTVVRSSMKSLSRESGACSACVVFDIQANMTSQSRRSS